nr:multidrug resistance efflux transporter family protein [uncultured Desulfobulbus sp.]
MIRLMLIGLAAGLFFSTTFILNRAMSLEGGHWYWSAALRYLYMVVLLSFGLFALKGLGFLRRILVEFIRHALFWILSGSIGFGCFYALLCFAADFAPGWVIATTWQLTIIATLLVLHCFGGRFSKKIWFYALVVFAGVSLVNLSHVHPGDLRSLLLGALPVLIAAFCYPLGNQLVWEASHGNPRLPRIDGQLIANSFTKVLLLSLGSLPFWAVLYLCISPPPPASGQLINAGLVALFSGVIATTLFLHARGQADNASKLAAVDATQSSEVLFALIGEIVFLHASLPHFTGCVGVCITIAGLIAFVRHDH